MANLTQSFYLFFYQQTKIKNNNKKNNSIYHFLSLCHKYKRNKKEFVLFIIYYFNKITIEIKTETVVYFIFLFFIYDVLSFAAVAVCCSAAATAAITATITTTISTTTVQFFFCAVFSFSAHYYQLTIF